MLVKCWKVLRAARPRRRLVTTATVIRRRPRPARWALVCVTIGAPPALYGGITALPALPGGAPPQPIPAWVAERLAAAEPIPVIAVSEPTTLAIFAGALILWRAFR